MTSAPVAERAVEFNNVRFSYNRAEVLLPELCGRLQDVEDGTLQARIRGPAGDV